MNPTNSFNLRTATVVMVVVGLLILALAGYLNPLFRATLIPLTEVQSWVSTRYVAIVEFFTVPRDVASLRQRNAELEAQVANLQAQVIDLQQRVGEAEMMEALLRFRRSNPQSSYIAASVIGRDPLPFLSYLIIDKGSDQGLRRGMPVVTEKGLVGRIDAVWPTAARIQLITDAGSAVNVQLQSTQTEAILSGSMTGDLELSMIPPDVVIQTGDVVLTSGLGGNYPANLFLGQVVSIRRKENDLFQGALIQPAVDFAELKVVLVITDFQPVDISPLLPTRTP